MGGGYRAGIGGGGPPGSAQGSNPFGLALPNQGGPLNLWGGDSPNVVQAGGEAEGQAGRSTGGGGSYPTGDPTQGGIPVGTLPGIMTPITQSVRDTSGITFDPNAPGGQDGAHPWLGPGSQILNHYGAGTGLGYEDYAPPGDLPSAYLMGPWATPERQQGLPLGGGMNPTSPEYRIANLTTGDLTREELDRRQSLYGYRGAQLLDQLSRLRTGGDPSSQWDPEITFNQMLDIARTHPQRAGRDRNISYLDNLQRDLGLVYGGSAAPGVHMSGTGRWTP